MKLSTINALVGVIMKIDTKEISDAKARTATKALTISKTH